MNSLKLHESKSLAPDGRPLPPTAERMLGLLRRAVQYAEQLNCSAREFAVQLSDVRAAGVKASDLRWLLASGQVPHLIESTRPNSKRRSFRPAGNLAFTDRSCFLLAGRDLTLAKTTGDGRFTGAIDDRMTRAGGGKPPQIVPKWEPLSRTLYMGELIVKHFRVPARSQEAILAAFEDERWPAFIYNPLNGRGVDDAKRRLHNAINGLNRDQEKRLVQFRGNGCGEGIGWFPT
jgi:hypothetical protein